MNEQQDLKMQLLEKYGDVKDKQSIDFCREAYQFLVEGDIVKFECTKEGTVTIERTTPVRSKSASAPIAVDLGLPSGRLWADRNIGASSPEDVGLYFSWGNTDGHVFGTDYNFCEDYENTPGSKLTGDIDAENDAATVNMGAPWRLPTSDDFQELCDNCTHELCYRNGYKGMLFTSKINGNSTFFPCSGYGFGSSWFSRGGRGYYWSSSLYSAALGRDLRFGSGGVSPQHNYNRFYGFAGRAVQ